MSEVKQGMLLTVAVVVLGEDGYLCVTRKADRLMSIEQRRVGLPGGKVEAQDRRGRENVGALLVAAAQRELQEETGISVLKPGLLCPFFADVDDDENWCQAFLLKGVVIPDDRVLKAEEGTVILDLQRDEILARAAWPNFYARLFDKLGGYVTHTGFAPAVWS